MGFRERLRDARPILKDGATGTELARRGVDVSLPLWSAHALTKAPAVLREIHADYVAAGAELVTANTFRTNVRAAGPDARPLTKRAVTIALEAGATWVAGSVAPVEDCYHPERVPPDDVLRREHKAHAFNLADAGVCVLLIETMNTVREAAIALEAAQAADLPAMVSFACADGRLLSGEPLEDAVRAVADADAILVNCVAPEAVPDFLARLRSATTKPIGAYANVLSSPMLPDLYARLAASWVKAGAQIVGGCCGTTPAHIAATAGLLK